MSDHSRNLITTAGLKWLGILEKEFDNAFVDLDLLIGGFDDEQNELIYECRQKMTALSATFAQLSHKCAAVFENNTKLERDVTAARKEIVHLRSENKIIQNQLQQKTNELENLNGAYHSRRRPEARFLNSFMHAPNARPKIPSTPTFETIHMQQEIKQLRKENLNLRRYLFNLESELFGTRMAIKYLEKELSGRIQQIQLLGKSDLRGKDQDRVWNQLEAEIHLHRHKTVARVVRGRSTISGKTAEAPPEHYSNQLKKRKGLGDRRLVVIEKEAEEALGISITGGAEHFIPPLISALHKNSPASRCGQLYVGDAIMSVNGIDLQNFKHEDVVTILSSQKGTFTLEVQFVSPDEESDEEEEDWRYDIFSVIDDKSEAEQYGDIEAQYVHKGDEKDETKDVIGIDTDLDTRNDDSNNETADSDNLSSVTADAYTTSPNKFYPGFAKLCIGDTEVLNSASETSSNEQHRSQRNRYIHHQNSNSADQNGIQGIGVHTQTTALGKKITLIN